MKELTGSKLFIIAIVCGLVAAGLVVFYMEQVADKYRRAAQPEQTPMVSVVVPRKNLARGTRITTKDIAARQIPRKYLPANVVTAKHYKSLVNRTLLSPVQRGRPITWEAVTDGKAATFSEVVDMGRRAMTIKIDRVDTIDGLLRPGDIIDLMGVFSLQDLGIQGAASSQQTSDDIVMPVLEQVQVLEASRQDLNGTRYETRRDRNSADGFNMEFTMITLNLTKKQVARVKVAQQTGDLFAVLRHPKDTSRIKYDYLGVDLLLQDPANPSIDIVMDESGRPIGRVIGNNIVDKDGNIIGKVVDGKAVALDGSTLGAIVRNVDPDDPILRVADVADVVRDENGNIVGRVVDGKVLDKAGNVIGQVDENGNPVGLDGEALGHIERDVALDARGNAVDTRTSSVAENRLHREKVVRDENGNVIGRVVNGKVVDRNGRVIGMLDDEGRAVGLDGRGLGKVEEALVSRNGEVAARVAEVVRDADGNVVGYVRDGKVVDKNDNVVGAVGEDGIARSLNGEKLGDISKAMVNEEGEVVASVGTVVRDKNGEIIGRVVDGKVLDADGNVIGRVTEDGTVVDASGAVIGQTEEVVVDRNGHAIEPAVQVVRDAEGNIIGRLEDGKVVNRNGEVLGHYQDGKIVGADGRVIAAGVHVTTDSASAATAEARDQALAEARRALQSVRFVEFIAGGTAEDGITPVTRVRVE